MSDAAEILFGPVGREVAAAAQILFFIFLMGAHILTFSIMMNTLTDHGACTVIFCVVGAVLCFFLTLSRRLQEVSYLGIICTLHTLWKLLIYGNLLLIASLSIFISVIITVIAIGIKAPDPVAHAINHPSLLSGFSATLNIVISFAGHLAFFSFQSELTDPKDFPKALFALQATDTSLYLVAAVIIYRYAGDGVQSPALLSTSPIISKVVFGIAIGTIVIAGVIIAHVGAKTIYVRMFRGTKRMNQKSLVSYGTWVLIVLILWVVAWVIANAIPVFNDILNILAAAFASWFSFGLEGLFWLHMNKGTINSVRKISLAILNVFLVLMCCVLVSTSHSLVKPHWTDRDSQCGMGLWVSGESVAISVKTAHAPFSCADNR